MVNLFVSKISRSSCSLFYIWIWRAFLQNHPVRPHFTSN